MPPPKDPIKLEEYKQKQRKIALEKGYGKWMKGKKMSQTTLIKMSASQRALITPKEKERRSKRAKEKGYGKWMLGRKATPAFIQLGRSRKGKTYEEIYGERSEEEIRKRDSKGHPHIFHSEENRNRSKTSMKRKGKTYEEIYGVNAEDEKRKRVLSHQKRWENKIRKGCRDKINGETKYKEWRTSVFKRDKYTCTDCETKGGILHAHHILDWANHPELRYDINNGSTLCTSCHSKQHPNIQKLILSNLQ